MKRTEITCPNGHDPKGTCYICNGPVEEHPFIWMNDGSIAHKECYKSRHGDSMPGIHTPKGG